MYRKYDHAGRGKHDSLIRDFKYDECCEKLFKGPISGL